MRTDKLNLAIKKVMGESSKKILMKLLFPFRNNFILFNISNRAKEGRVNLDYWDESNNLGDTLSPVVVNYMLDLRDTKLNTTIDGKKHLYAIGSILTAGIQDATVWGSGVLNAKLTYRLERRKLDIRAVRGPITRAILIDYGYSVPEIYGDPAIIMPEIYKAVPLKNRKKYGLITHKDYILKEKYKEKEIARLNICTDDYQGFLDQLVSVDIVISSSLHGIILAEAYGVPAILLKPQIDMVKYYDYYYSTGRLNFPIADSIEQAMLIEPVELPELDSIREKLKMSFPYDIFGEEQKK